MPRPGPKADGRAALVVAHPGHELRVLTWLELSRPPVFVLTDGSGHGGRSRLHSTAKVIERAGARPGSIFGSLSDRDAYRLILEGDHGRLEDLILELSAQLEEADVDVVVSDAVEGFNPVHDLCFVIAEGAARLVSRRFGRPVRHYDFLLEAAPDTAIGSGNGHPVRLELDDDAWRRKLEAAKAYGELQEEVERALIRHGPEAFRVEVLRPAAAGRRLADLFPEPPFYESHGERRVADGNYDQVLRFREHFLPLAEAVRSLTAPS